MNLGKQIAYYRKNKNITQDALAKLLGISNQAVSKWETEQSYPDIELLPKIADIFDISLDELFERAYTLPEKVQEAEPAFEEAFATQPPLYDKLPWANDETLRLVLFQGHNLIKQDALKKHFGKICNDVTFHICGTALNVESYFSVNCEDVAGNVTAGSYVECDDVGQHIIAGSYVECEDVGNYVIAGSYVECEDIGQNATAGSYMECGDVNGNVNAGGYVECGNVGGDVRAEGNVECGDISGNINAKGQVNWNE